MTTPPHVEVHWRDACLRSTAVPLSQWGTVARLSDRRTAGYLVHDCAEADKGEGKECPTCPEPVLVLAMTCDPPDGEHEEPQIDDLYTIPRAWVRRVRYLSRRRVKPRVEKETSL